MLLSSAVLVLLFAGAHRFPRAPVPLVVMVLAALATTVLDLQADGIRVVGDVATGLPRPGVPDLSAADLVALLLPAVGVTVVAYTDNVLTARAFAVRNGYRIDANQELLALGAANVATGFAQTFPVSSSGSRTVIGEALGSHSQLYSLVTVVAVAGPGSSRVDPPLSVVILLPWRPSTGRKRQLPVIVPSPVMFFVTLAGSPV